VKLPPSLRKFLEEGLEDLSPEQRDQLESVSSSIAFGSNTVRLRLEVLPEKAKARVMAASASGD
jgi:hypothetical protein